MGNSRRRTRGDSSGNRIARCVRCGGEFISHSVSDTLRLTTDKQYCPDCDPEKVPSNLIQEVGVEDAEALRMTEGMEMLEDENAELSNDRAYMKHASLFEGPDN